ncbi:MAG: tRNA 2-selenouridine(34) synthase MnmH [Chitinophagaceae bacterium]
MAIEKVHIDRFLELAKSFPVLDVRSPAEFSQAHIPGAYSLPLFTDEERKVVGTAYKQQSRQVAIKAGLDFFGPKMRGMVETVEQIVGGWQLAIGNWQSGDGERKLQTENRVLVHCWRGGMRSAGVAWLLDLYGFKVYTLVGGYKTFRNWVLKQFDKPYHFQILGGFTGSGKTEVLKELKRMNQYVVDLEALAGHKGSAFGNIGLPPQPSQEMFENKLAIQLHYVACEPQNDAPARTVWLEDESQRIGTVNIPQPMWRAMRTAPIFFLGISFEERLEHIISEYGALDKQKVQDAIGRVQKRLGGLETKTAIAHLEENNVRECFRILLKYYDRYYQKGLVNREQLHTLLTMVNCTTVEASGNAVKILESTQSIPVE